MSDLLDVYLAAAWAIALVAVGVVLVKPRRPRHTWGELSSSDIANAERRRRR